MLLLELMGNFPLEDGSEMKARLAQNTLKCTQAQTTNVRTKHTFSTQGYTCSYSHPH